MGDIVTPDQPQQFGPEGDGVSPTTICGGYADAASPCQQKRLPRAGWFQSRGPRDYQEDRVSVLEEFLSCSSPGRPSVELYAVFDGHGGTAAVDFVLEKLPAALLARFVDDFYSFGAEQVNEALCRAFEETEEELLDNLKSICQAGGALQLPAGGDSLPRTRSVVPRTGLSAGSCACVAVLCGNQLYLANLGDCRALVRTHTGMRELTQDHRPDVHPAERSRLEELGVEVSSDGYIHGQISVSRSFGDLSLENGTKCHGLLARPEVSEHQLEVGTEFLLLVCDGILEKMTSVEAVQTVRRCLRVTKDPAAAAQKLVAMADKLESPDNLSAVVVLFKVPPPTDNGRTAPKLFGPRRPALGG